MKKLFCTVLLSLLLLSCAPLKNTEPSTLPPPISAEDELPPVTPPQISYPASPEHCADAYLDSKAVRLYEKDGVRYIRLIDLCDYEVSTDGENFTAKFNFKGRSYDADGFFDGKDWYITTELLNSLGFKTFNETGELLFTYIPTSIPEDIEIPVLMYHAVSDEVWGIRELFVKPENMEKQIVWLLDNGYTPIFFEDLASLDGIEKPVILTFDDGYDDNYLYLYPILKKYNVKATVFIITDTVGWKNKLTEEQILEMSRSGLVSFQSHTATHPDLDLVSPEQQERELTSSKLYLARLLKKESFVLCYPTGRYDSSALKFTKENYSFAVTMNDSRLYNTSDDPYTVRREYIARSTTLSQFEKMLTK